MISLISFLIDLYILVIIVRVIVSWVGVNPLHPAVQFMHNLTEPLLAPIRKAMDPWQGNWGIDLSPLVLIIALSVIQSMLIATVRY